MASRILPVDNIPTFQTLATIILGAVSVYATTRVIYLLYFHPLSKFPGPRIAAVSNIWYGYHWLTGRYPWAIEKAIRKYGPVVRIAPNDLVFFTPQAFVDIYGTHKSNLELFIKSDFNDRGDGLAGIIWERDPVRHREVARKLGPAFNHKSIRAMQPIVHEHFDYFVSRMEELGAAPGGVGLADWSNWLAMDVSADMSWNEKLYQMRDMKHSIHLDVLLGFNAFATVMQVFSRFPLLKPLQYLFVPFSKIKTLKEMQEATKLGVSRRMDRRGNTDHVDLFDFILPADEPVPTSQRELIQVAVLAAQVMFAEYSPMSDWFYSTLLFLLEEPECRRHLTEEIRGTFKHYSDIKPEALISLPYLHACLEESLRAFPINNTGLPRVSPGATVDGYYIPKGASVQTSMFTLARDPAYFHEPLRYRPERWLPVDHPLYDPAFSKDHLKGLYPFSLGPRVCLGKDLGWMQARLFIAKVLWTFDIEKVPGQEDFDLDASLRHYGFFDKPEFNIRFIPANKRDDAL